MLKIDLTGRRAFVVGIADDGGFGFAIAKALAEAGASVEFGQVLLVGAGSSVTLGAPFISSAKVVATVQSHGKGDKVRIVKFRRRKHYKREGTHRQPYTEVKITQIVA